MTQPSDFAGFANVKLVEGETSNSVIYSPNGPADAHLIDTFAVHDLEGSGYDWQSIVHAYLLEHDEPMLKRFRFDSEAGMFCAYGDDLAALHAVATTVESLLGDVDLVARMLLVAVENDLLD